MFINLILIGILTIRFINKFNHNAKYDKIDMKDLCNNIKLKDINGG